MAAIESHFTVWSPSKKPSISLSLDEHEPYRLERTHSGSSTQVPDEHDLGLERSLSHMSSVNRQESGRSSGEEFPDGPSLTADGIALDLDAGAPLFFAHDKLCSPSHERKMSLKEHARLLRESRRARARWLVAAEEVCSLDASGVVYGEENMEPALFGDCDGRAARLKLFHRKWRARHGNSQADWPTVCLDSHGRALMYLELGKSQSQRERLQQRRASLASGARCFDKVAAIDPSGTLRRPATSEFARYLFTLAPETQQKQELQAEEIYMEHRPRPAWAHMPCEEHPEFAHYLFEFAPEQ